jgi:CheY-like chemotaxis protein
MDVVWSTIVHRLKGQVRLASTPGAGSTLTLRLPLTLAIIQVLLARAGGEVFAIPLDPVSRTLTRAPETVAFIQEREVIAIDDRQIPLIRIAHVLELPTDAYADEAQLHIILVEVAGELYGLVCDGLLGKREIVIKSLGELLKNVPCAAGATLLGDRCAIILDISALVTRALRQPARRPRSTASAAGAAAERAGPPHILLVEDSDIVRESLRRLLVQAGYRCTTARDGVEGLEQARAHRFDLVSTDVMMPRMDGYELTRELRQAPEYRDVPIVMVTSRGERIDRVRGFDAGVDEYITKPHDRQLLLRVVAKLLAQRAPGDAAADPDADGKEDEP